FPYTTLFRSVDQAFPELVEIENATDQNHGRRDVEEQDAAGQAGKDGMAEDPPNEREWMRPDAPRLAARAVVQFIGHVVFKQLVCHASSFPGTGYIPVRARLSSRNSVSPDQAASRKR